MLGGSALARQATQAIFRLLMRPRRPDPLEHWENAPGQIDGHETDPEDIAFLRRAIVKAIPSRSFFRTLPPFRWVWSKKGRIRYGYRRPKEWKPLTELAETWLCFRSGWNTDIFKGRRPASFSTGGSGAYRVLHPQQLLFQIKPRIRALRVVSWKRFGNSVAQLRNVITLAETLKVQVIEFSEPHPCFSGEHAGKIALNWQPKSATVPTLEGDFFSLKAFGIPAQSDTSRIFKKYIRRLLLPLLRIPDERLRDDDLVVHLRAGDVFVGTHYLGYGQPPLSFYIAAIERERPSRVWLVFEDRSNPCIDALEKDLSSRGVEVLSQSGALVDDLRLLMTARRLVIGRGSFGLAIAHLSSRLRKLYLFETGHNAGSLRRLGIDVIRGMDRVGEFKTKVLSGNWTASTQQRELLLSYPVSNVGFKNLPAKRRGARPTAYHAIDTLERALWAGFSQLAIKELSSLQSSADSEQVLRAALALARWFAHNGEYHRALEHLTRAQSIPSSFLRTASNQLLATHILIGVGAFEAAHDAVKNAIDCFGETPEFCQAAANVFARSPQHDQARLEWINKPFISAGLSGICKANHDLPLGFNNLAAPSLTTNPLSSEAKVSILMPVYNAMTTLPVAVSSVLGQTWNNIELIVVDDASTDNTWSVIQNLQALDARIISVRHVKNRGAYAARNTGLERATGDLVTVHDADDWSHPQKIAVQACDLLHTGAPYNTTSFIRVFPDLRIRLTRNPSRAPDYQTSLMTKRDYLVALGGWDEVRFGADTELYARLRATHCAQSRIRVPSIPLTFALQHEASLTRSNVTGIQTLKYGARFAYKEAQEHWRNLELKKTTPDLRTVAGERRFPVPTICVEHKIEPLHYDFLFVSDFTLEKTCSVDFLELIRATHRLKSSQACFHWPQMHTAGKRLTDGFRQLLSDKIVDIVVVPETVKCNTLFFLPQETTFAKRPDNILGVTTDNCVVVYCKEEKLNDVNKTIEDSRKYFNVQQEISLVPVQDLLHQHDGKLRRLVS